MEKTFMNYVECDITEGLELVEWRRNRTPARTSRRLRLRFRFA
jgi:hypothetical protein